MIFNFILHLTTHLKVKVKSLSCVWLCDPMDCSLPGSSVHAIFQARVLEWIAISFSFVLLEKIWGLPYYNFPWMEEPGRLQSMGPLKVRHDWATSLSCIGEGNGNPFQCSCLENPRDGVTWWAAIYGVAQSRTRLSSSSSHYNFLHTFDNI